MRNLLLSFILTFSTITFGQLPVTPIAQKASNWCWAASLEMIIKYHQSGNTVSQCDLVRRYSLHRATRVLGSIPCTSCSISEICSLDYKKNSATLGCNYGMTKSLFPGFLNLIQITQTAQIEIGALRSQSAVRSELSNEISNNRPFIANISAMSPCKPEHTTVGIEVYNNDFITIIDPHYRKCEPAVRQCNINSALIRVSALGTPPEYACNFMTNIVIPSGFSIVNINHEKKTLNLEWKNSFDKELTSDQLDEFVNSKSFIKVSMKYLSYEKLSNSKTISSNLDDYLLDYEAIELISTKKPFNSTAFYKFKDKWIPYMKWQNRSDILELWMGKFKSPQQNPLFDPGFKLRPYAFRINPSFLIRFPHLKQEFIEYSFKGKAVYFPLEPYKVKDYSGKTLLSFNSLTRSSNIIKDISTVLIWENKLEKMIK